MKLFTLLISMALAKFSKTDYCTFRNCDNCDIVLKTDKKGFIYNRFGPKCRTMMNQSSCCQKFMICDPLMECIPHFPSGHQKKFQDYVGLRSPTVHHFNLKKSKVVTKTKSSTSKLSPTSPLSFRNKKNSMKNSPFAYYRQILENPQHGIRYKYWYFL